MGVSYRELLRAQSKAKKNPGFSRALKGETPKSGSEIWAKYARVARYRHRKKDTARQASQRMI